MWSSWDKASPSVCEEVVSAVPVRQSDTYILRHNLYNLTNGHQNS